MPLERLARERALLGPLRSLRPRIGRATMRTVDKLSWVRIGSARYSVPARLVGRSVDVIADHALVAPREAVRHRRALRQHTRSRETVAVPGLVTGVGRVRPETCARQGRQAIEVSRIRGRLPESWVDASWNDQMLYTEDPGRLQPGTRSTAIRRPEIGRSAAREDPAVGESGLCNLGAAG